MEEDSEPLRNAGKGVLKVFEWTRSIQIMSEEISSEGRLFNSVVELALNLRRIRIQMQSSAKREGDKTNPAIGKVFEIERGAWAEIAAINNVLLPYLEPVELDLTTQLKGRSSRAGGKATGKAGGKLDFASQVMYSLFMKGGVEGRRNRLEVLKVELKGILAELHPGGKPGL
ncbi:hypothetical protein CC79DRAFT_1353572 [Sarocladium strictum]